PALRLRHALESVERLLACDAQVAVCCLCEEFVVYLAPLKGIHKAPRAGEVGAHVIPVVRQSDRIARVVLADRDDVAVKCGAAHAEFGQLPYYRGVVGLVALVRKLAKLGMSRPTLDGDVIPISQ